MGVIYSDLEVLTVELFGDLDLRIRSNSIYEYHDTLHLFDIWEGSALPKMYEFPKLFVGERCYRETFKDFQLRSEYATSFSKAKEPFLPINGLPDV